VGGGGGEAAWMISMIVGTVLCTDDTAGVAEGIVADNSVGSAIKQPR